MAQTRVFQNSLTFTRDSLLCMTSFAKCRHYVTSAFRASIAVVNSGSLPFRVVCRQPARLVLAARGGRAVRGGGAARAAAPGVLLQRGAGLGLALRALRRRRLPLPQGLRQGAAGFLIRREKNEDASISCLELTTQHHH